MNLKQELTKFRDFVIAATIIVTILYVFGEGYLFGTNISKNVIIILLLVSLYFYFNLEPRQNNNSLHTPGVVVEKDIKAGEVTLNGGRHS